MDDMARHYLGRETIHFEDVAGKGAKQILFSEVSIEAASEYAAEDADVTLQLHQELSGSMAKAPSLEKVLDEIEIPLVSVLAKVERNGALVDANMLLAQSEELGERLGGIRDSVWSIAGEEFNLDSTKQLQEILYEKQGLPVLKKTPGGKPSTAEPVLVDLARDYDLPAAILEYRSLSKLKTTYADKLPLQINEKSGRIHTSYHQAVTATGRLSSTNPNLQNIPIKSEEGRRIRQAFVPKAGSKIIAAVYSQIELRIMAHLSKDEQLCRAFHEGIDVHRATAAEVFGLPPEAVSDEERRSAKAINFGLIYGMSAFGLAKQLGVSRGEAQKYVDRYFEKYPGVKTFMEETQAFADEKGYVETIFGRRLYVPNIHSGNAVVRKAAQRAAINAPMQGSAADIIRLAMIKIDNILEEKKIAKMLLQIHDELIFECLKKDENNVKKLIQNAMVSVSSSEYHKFSIPLEVGVNSGNNWGEAH